MSRFNVKLNKDQVYLLKLFLISVLGIAGVFGLLIVTVYFVSEMKVPVESSNSTNITGIENSLESEMR